jgi:hypothetical protein
MKLNTLTPQFYLVAILVLLTSPVLLAQQPASETLQQRINTPSQTSNLPTVPPSATANSDLGQIGVVQTFPKPEMFTLSTSQQFFYTDNVFYTSQKTGTVGSLAYLGSYTASYVPYSLRDWTPRISLQYNMVRYNSVASGDFDNENASFSSQYVFGDDRSWTWGSSATLANFTDPHQNDHQFYKEVVYDNQVSNVQQVCKSVPIFFVAAYDLAYHQASPAIFDRLDNSLSLSFVFYPIPELSISPYLRPGARTYFVNGTYFPSGTFTTGIAQTDRDDFNLAVGLDVTWQPWKYVAFSADFTHDEDYSNNSYLGYSDTQPGISVTGTIKF